jgi:probable phosphoglycerate mutase
VSDLQCAARLFIARHGEADLAARERSSAAGAPPTVEGVRQVRELAEQLRPVRISTVCSSPDPAASASAQAAAADLDVASRVVDGLQGLDPAEGEPAAVARFQAAVEEIADLHRGEDVLVFSHGDVMSLVIPMLSGNVRADLADGHRLPPCVPVRVDVDADGWRLDSWPAADDAAPV